jgi:hypothetical protein
MMTAEDFYVGLMACSLRAVQQRRSSGVRRSRKSHR